MLVLAPGLSPTLQDHGRRAGLASGIPPGGAADDLAYSLSCLVLGNPPGAAAIEQVLKGGRYQIIATSCRQASPGMAASGTWESPGEASRAIASSAARRRTSMASLADIRAAGSGPGTY